MSGRTRQSLDVVLDDARLGAATTIGTLHCDQHGVDAVIRFEYSVDYLGLRHAVAIDPQLPLVPGPSYPARGQHLFGIFRDTAPDRWGRMLMERREALEADAADRKVRHLSEWDFLIGVNDFARMGALRLRRTTPPPIFVDDHECGAPPAARLRELQAVARAMSRDDAEQHPQYTAWLAQLIAPGTSLGGRTPQSHLRRGRRRLVAGQIPRPR